MAKTLLFIPVSSAEGVGEYMRSLIIAKAAIGHWPQLKIHFILSKQAPYANDCHFTTHLVERSPTKETSAVNRIIKTLAPDIVIFDASGRKSQFAAAKSIGAKVIFISQHKKKRAKGMKVGRAQLTDLHWVAQPEFAIAKLTLRELLKCALFNLPVPKHIGMVFTPPKPCLTQQTLARYQLHSGQYLLVNAGSGAHKVNGELAADLFARQAEALAREGYQVVMVYGVNYPKTILEASNVISIASLENDAFIALLYQAKAAFLSGGGTMLQALALNIPVVAMPVAKDQHKRVFACKQAQLIADIDVNDDVFGKLLSSLQEENLNALKQSMASLNMSNGLTPILRDLSRMLSDGKQSVGK